MIDYRYVILQMSNITAKFYQGKVKAAFCEVIFSCHLTKQNVGFVQLKNKSPSGAIVIINTCLQQGIFLAHFAHGAGDLLGCSIIKCPSSVGGASVNVLLKQYLLFYCSVSFNELGRNTLCIQLYQNCSKDVIPCRNLVAMANKKIKLLIHVL